MLYLSEDLLDLIAINKKKKTDDDDINHPILKATCISLKHKPRERLSNSKTCQIASEFPAKDPLANYKHIVIYKDNVSEVTGLDIKRNHFILVSCFAPIC